MNIGEIQTLVIFMQKLYLLKNVNIDYIQIKIGEIYVNILYIYANDFFWFIL